MDILPVILRILLMKMILDFVTRIMPKDSALELFDVRWLIKSSKIVLAAIGQVKLRLLISYSEDKSSLKCNESL